MIRRAAILLAFLLVLIGTPSGLKAQGATAEQYYQYGNRYYAAKNYNFAARYYYAAVKMNPNLAPAYQGLGNCYLLMNRKTEALAYYEKALALNPSNPQLSAYVNSLRSQVGSAAPAAGAAAAPAAAGQTAMAQGVKLFQGKQYAAAIPYLEQATKDSPNDYQPFYYLGYAQYMSRDFKNAAVNFYLANQKKPNPQLKAYADRIKASLPAADQQWVDAKVAGGGAAKETAVAAKYKKGGIRALFGLATFKLKDFDADADTQQSWALAAGYGLNGEVPKGNMWLGAEPFYRPSPSLDLALGFGVFPVGKYSYTALGYGLLPTNSANDAIRNVFKMNADQISLTVRYFLGKGKHKPFLGAGGAYYPAKITWSRSVASEDGSINSGFNGDFTSSGMGGHIMLGAELGMGPSVALAPYVQYRMAKLKDFTGSLVNNLTGETTEGTLSLFSNPVTGDVVGLDDGTALPAGVTARPLELDLSGIQFGVGVSVLF